MNVFDMEITRISNIIVDAEESGEWPEHWPSIETMSRFTEILIRLAESEDMVSGIYSGVTEVSFSYSTHIAEINFIALNLSLKVTDTNA